MGRFYETTFYDHGQMFIGWQLLASPANIADTQIDYAPLLDGLEGRLIDKEDRRVLFLTLALIGDPTTKWGREALSSTSLDSVISELPLGYIEKVLDAPYFAAETSPLKARSILQIVGLAESIHLVMIGHDPKLVLMGDGLGVVVIRSLTAVGGPIWDGAREELKEFGRDIAAEQLDLIRRRLGIKKRGRKR